MQHRLWRTFGALAIANIVLVFAALAVQKMTPELGSSRQDVAQNYLHGALASRFAGGYAEALSGLVFLAAGLLLARLLRGRDEWSGWLSSCIGATAIMNVGSALIVGFPAGAAALYGGHHGASLDSVIMANDIRNFAFFLSIADLGVFTLCVGVAALVTRQLPRFIGWSGVGVGVLCVAAVAGAGAGAHNLASMVQMVWWVALGIVALSRRAAVPAARPREAAARV